MHFGLTGEQEMIVGAVRRFVENEIYPHEPLVERTGEVPPEVAQAIKQKTIDLGFYACNFPEAVGGAGLSHLEFALVERELGRGSMALTTAEYPDGLHGRTDRALPLASGARRADGCPRDDRTGRRIRRARHEMRRPTRRG